MAIPEFQDLMLPLLMVTAGREELSILEAVRLLADQFHLTEIERTELLPSKRQGRFHNRVGWAKSDLLNAKLLEKPVERGFASHREEEKSCRRLRFASIADS